MAPRCGSICRGCRDWRQTQPRTGSRRHCRGGVETILVVDDNTEMRTVARRHLISLGYSVSEAGSGPAALAILQDGGRFDLLFTDVVMPEGMTGYQLAAAARHIQPGLKVLMTTGYARPGIDPEPFAAHLATILPKPYRKQELAITVAGCAGGVKRHPSSPRTAGGSREGLPSGRLTQGLGGGACPRVPDPRVGGRGPALGPLDPRVAGGGLAPQPRPHHPSRPGHTPTSNFRSTASPKLPVSRATTMNASGPPMTFPR